MRKSLVVFVSLIVFILLAVTPARALTLLTDDFSSGADQWTPKGGNWLIESGEYSQDDTTTWRIAVAGDGAWTHVAMEAKVKTIESNDGGGIVVRYQDEDNFATAVIRSKQNEVHFNRRVAGLWESHIGVTMNIDADTFYILKVEVNDTEYKVYVDDVLKITVTRPGLTSGKIGLLTSNAHVHFDDVIVENPLDFNAVPEPAPLMILVSFVAALATYGLIKKRTGSKAIVKPYK